MAFIGEDVLKMIALRCDLSVYKTITGKYWFTTRKDPGTPIFSDLKLKEAYHFLCGYERALADRVYRNT